MRWIASLALFMIAALPLASPADSVVKNVSYTTAYHQTVPIASGGQYTGYLQLTFYKSGIISGWYRDEYQLAQELVVGGFDGEKIWFSIGNRGRNQFTGTILPNGSISGTLSGWRRAETSAFTATPKK